MEAEIGLRMLQAQEHQGLLASDRSKGRGMKHLLPQEEPTL